MSKYDPRSRAGGVDPQPGIGTGVHVEMKRACRRLTVQDPSIHVSLWRFDLGEVGKGESEEGKGGRAVKGRWGESWRGKMKFSDKVVHKLHIGSEKGIKLEGIP